MSIQSLSPLSLSSLLFFPLLIYFLFSELVNKDPALWPIEMHDNVRQKYLDKGYEYFQKEDNNFDASIRQYKNQNRLLSSKVFSRILANGEKCMRNWLIYSESTGNVFCYVCKLFNKNNTNKFVNGGFSNWKKAEEKIGGHENSAEHKKCMLIWLTYMHEKSHINNYMAKQLQVEIKFWTEVLKRIVEVIRFLSTRGLAFRGEHEVIGSPNNGNYLGVMELISKFDPFLKEHFNLHANQGRGHVSYLSKDICEEFIHIMANKVKNEIVSQIKRAKYFSLIVDSTPDVSHVDQLSIVFRYCLDGYVYERFFCFLPINSHTGASLNETILQVLCDNEIDIVYCRAQTYDNASNMSGKYSGLQARIKEVNPLAYYVPCVGHSLNLVGECSVDECIDSVNFFRLVQRLYTFFSVSTHRWSILLKHASTTLKSLSSTRWSCRDDAITALAENYTELYNSLYEIEQSEREKTETRHEAASLKNKLTKLETAFMTVFWHRILSRFNTTSKFLQKIELDLITANNMLHSLVNFISDLRNDFAVIENDSKNLGSFVQQEYSDSKKRKITSKYADNVTEIQNLDGCEKFRIESFNVIVDKLRVELEKRSSAYNHITELFGFLTKLTTIEIDEMRECADRLVSIYSHDLERSLGCELEQFISFIKTSFKNVAFFPLDILKWMCDRKLDEVFPNIYVAFRLFLTIPIANCEAERSFSKLTIIKNKYRSAMTDTRLSSLALLAIESELVKNIDFNDLIDEFARIKSRKKIL